MESNKRNGALASRRWHQPRAERDDLEPHSLFDVGQDSQPESPHVSGTVFPVTRRSVERRVRRVRERCS